MLEPLDSELHNLHLLGSKCLVKVNNGQSCLKVLNPPNQRVRLCRGKFVATVLNFDRDTCSVYNLDETQSLPYKTASVNMVQTQAKTETSANTQTTNKTNDISFDIRKADQNTHQKQTLEQHR